MHGTESDRPGTDKGSTTMDRSAATLLANMHDTGRYDALLAELVGDDESIDLR